MKEKRQIIDEFAAVLNQSIFNSVEQDIPFERLGKSNNILILQSAPISIVEKIIRQMEQVNGNARYVIIGSDACSEISRSNPQLKAVYISHNKCFDGNDVETVKRVIEEEAIDTLLFFNNFVSSVDFSNVEHLVSFVADRLSVYGYSYVQQELSRYLNITAHLYGGIAYKSLVEWYEKSGEWREGE